MKRRIITVVIGLTVLASAVGLVGFFSSQREDPKIETPPVVKKYVDTKQVTYSNIDTEVITYGRVRTANSLDLLSEISGRMYEGNIRLKAGQNFKKGTLLFYIDDKEASLNLKSDKSNFLRDLAAIMPDLKIDFAESFESWDGYFTKLDIDKNFPELPEARSNKEKTFLATKGIYSSYYSIMSTEERLRKHRYYAPFDGSISEVVMESGAFVSPGTRIGKIMRSGVHELQVSVETVDVAWIKKGSSAKVFSENVEQGWMGTVTRISDFVNENTQSVDVFIAIETNGQKIYDGQFMRAAIPSRTIQDGMIIPRDVIYNGNEVFVLEDSLLRVMTVNIFKTDDDIAIVNGLEEGVELVIEPVLNAHNNSKAFKRETKDIDLEKKGSGETKLTNNSKDGGSNASNVSN